MDESKVIKEITDGVILDKEVENIVSQVNEFERYISEMNITVEKRQLILHREDELPRMDYYNY